jgi:hypothetical protein
MKSILLAPILVLLSVESVSACWCQREVVDTEAKFRVAVSEAVKQSNAVFVGEIIEQNRSQLRVKVEKVWKGEVGDQIILVTRDWQDGDRGSIDSCAYPFKVGTKYLIYADTVKGELVTSKCSRTHPVNEAERDLNELDRAGRKGQERPCPVDLPCGGIPRFAEYGNIRASDERAVLDHFAKQLVMSPDEIAYVLIYAGQEACTNEARLRLVRIKNYLVKKHAIAADRVVLKDGGFRSDLSTQLWLLPSRATNLPEASPTLARANKLLGKCKLRALSSH